MKKLVVVLSMFFIVSLASCQSEEVLPNQSSIDTTGVQAELSAVPMLEDFERETD